MGSIGECTPRVRRVRRQALKEKCKAMLDNVHRRRETSVIWADCGSPTIVPFLPSQGRPARCRARFDRAARGASIRPVGIALHLSGQVEAIKD